MFYDIPEYNKNLILTDDIYFDVTTIKANDIQEILNKNKSVLATTKINNKLVSEIIYETSIKYELNPAIIIARLQTEQSLISKQTASQNTLDWALGVGCPSKAIRYQNFKGLDRQIEYACKKLGQEYLYSTKFLNGKSIPEKMIVEQFAADGTKIIINPQSKACYCLYIYNPEVGYSKNKNAITGNYLFYLVFKRYFGKV
jgi:transglutaminase-like putative cysteine protease